MVALSDAQKKANEKYLKNNYKQVKLSMPKAEAEALEEYLISQVPSCIIYLESESDVISDLPSVEY